MVGAMFVALAACAAANLPTSPIPPSIAKIMAMRDVFGIDMVDVMLNGRNAVDILWVCRFELCFANAIGMLASYYIYPMCQDDPHPLLTSTEHLVKLGPYRKNV